MQLDSFCKRNILNIPNEGMDTLGITTQMKNYDQINEIRSRSGSNFEIKDSFCKDNVEEQFQNVSGNIYGRSS